MFDAGEFPRTRLRRLRYNRRLREVIGPTRLESRQLILPLFVRDGESGRRPIESMPGHAQIGIEQLPAEIEQACHAGLGGVILFGIPSSKDALGSDCYDDEGIIQRAIREVKRVAPDLLVISDVCFCEYTDHGHCGAIQTRRGQSDVDNDATLEMLGKQAVSHAKSGVDIVAPSGMMDGMVGEIRQALDGSGYLELPILSYAVKYASAFYGPFRDAAESTPQFGDRRTYQMDPASDAGQALREARMDLREGADLIMVKPALPYLDILAAIRDHCPGVPLAAYNVSGEFSMIKAAAQNGWLDERETVLETLTSIRRAGASMIITYWAKDVARWLSGD